MANKTSLTFDLFGRDRTASSTMRGVGKNAESVGNRLGKVGIGIGIAFAAAAAGLIKVGFEAVESLKRLEVIGAQTNAVIESTGGVANVTAEEVRGLADALERTTATESEAIQEGANLLLTFTNIRNGVGKTERIFDRSTELLVDMARAMGTDVKSGAMQLGKALNDPVRGIAALNEVGVTFTKQQADMVKALVESGDVMGAQTVILDELQNQFGGSGAAYASTFAGQIDTLNHNLGATAEAVMIALMPALEDLVAWGNSDLIPWLEGFAAWFVEDGVPAIEKFVGWVIEYKDELLILVGTIGAVTAAQWLLNAAMAANPVGLIVTALIVLGGYFVWLGENFDTASGWVLDAADNVLLGLADIGMAFNGLVIGFVNSIGSMINSAMGPINAVREALGLPTSVVPTFRVENSGLQDMVDGILDARTLRDRTGRADSGTLGTYQNQSGSTGRGPRGLLMAAGGIVMPTPGGTAATIGEAGSAEAVIPLTRSALSRYGLGGGPNVTVQVSGTVVGSREELARVVVRAIEDAKKVGSVRRNALA